MEERACEPDRPRKGPTPGASPTPAGSCRTPSDSPADAGSSLHGLRGAGRDGASLRARSVPRGADAPCSPPALRGPGGPRRTRPLARAHPSTARGARDAMEGRACEPDRSGKGATPRAPPTPAGSCRTPSDSPADAGSSLHGPRGAGRDGGASHRARSVPEGTDALCSPNPCGVLSDPVGLARGRGLIPPRPEGRWAQWRGEPASPIGPGRDRRPVLPQPLRGPVGPRRTHPRTRAHPSTA